MDWGGEAEGEGQRHGPSPQPLRHFKPYPNNRQVNMFHFRELCKQYVAYILLLFMAGLGSRSRGRLKKNQEPERLGKKSGAGAGAAKK